MPGRVIHLNGTSSVGKTSLAAAIQAVAPDPWLAFSTDTMLAAVPPRWLADGEHEQEGIGRGVNGPVGEQFVAAMYAAVAAVARAGLDVVYEDVVLTQQSWSSSQDAWADLDVVRVGLRCSPEVLIHREQARGDRTPGAAIALDKLVHVAGTYDVELDTSSRSPEDLARRVLAALIDP